jgi:hypothetical protein
MTWRGSSCTDAESKRGVGHLHVDGKIGRGRWENNDGVEVTGESAQRGLAEKGAVGQQCWDMSTGWTGAKTDYEPTEHGDGGDEVREERGSRWSSGKASGYAARRR